MVLLDDSKATMNILVIDIGGTNVKIWTSGEEEKLKFPSGKTLTPDVLIEKVSEATADWKFDRVSIGYPGDVRNGRPVSANVVRRSDPSSSRIPATARTWGTRSSRTKASWSSIPVIARP